MVKNCSGNREGGEEVMPNGNQREVVEQKNVGVGGIGILADEDVPATAIHRLL